MLLRLAAIVAALGLLSACGRASDASVALAESAREVARDASAGTGAPASQGGIDRSVGENVPLPADFPADLRLPENYAVVSVTTMGPAQSVVLRSDAAMAAVFERFRADQAARGWIESVSMQGVEGAMLGLSKDGRGVVVNFRPDMAGHTVLSLSLQPQGAATR